MEAGNFAKWFSAECFPENHTVGFSIHAVCWNIWTLHSCVGEQSGGLCTCPLQRPAARCAFKKMDKNPTSICPAVRTTEPYLRNGNLQAPAWRSRTVSGGKGFKFLLNLSPKTSVYENINCIRSLHTNLSKSYTELRTRMQTKTSTMLL